MTQRLRSLPVEVYRGLPPSPGPARVNAFGSSFFPHSSGPEVEFEADVGRGCDFPEGPPSVPTLGRVQGEEG